MNLSLFKYFLKIYWFIEDGCGEGEEEGNKRIDSINEEIRLTKLKLKKTLIN